MTEAEWLACENPELMLLTVRDRASLRKMRLLGCACCRRMWAEMNNPVARQKVAIAERYADGEVNTDDFRAPFVASGRPPISSSRPVVYLLQAAHELGWPNERPLEWAFDEDEGEMREIPHQQPLSEYTTLSTLEVLREVVTAAGVDYAGHGRSRLTHPEEFHSGVQRESAAQAVLIRDVFGNPFRPVAFSSNWRTDTAVSLARGVYDARDFSAMPILADALQDAGCDSDDVLNHCRKEATHVRGCWVVDLVLGKE